MKSERRLRQVPAVRPTTACDAIPWGKAALDQITHRVGDVVDRRESPLLVIGMHERAAESPGTTHIRKKHGDARFQQGREELVVAWTALPFRATVQKEHRAHRFDA